MKYKTDKLPSEFASAKKAGEFWDTHDSTEYLADMEPVRVDVQMREKLADANDRRDLARAKKRNADKPGTSWAEVKKEFGFDF